MAKENIKIFLAIDYGRKRIGLAVGAIFPAGLGVMDAGKGREFVLEEICRLVDSQEVGGIIIGLPFRSQGEKGTLDQEIREFANDLHRCVKADIFFENEQFSSDEAKRQFSLHGKKISRESGEIDEMAAILILEQFLSRLETDGRIEPDIKA